MSNYLQTARPVFTCPVCRTKSNGFCLKPACIKAQQPPQLWVRVGDAGEYESFGDDLDALVDYLNELQVGTVTGWVDTGPGVGFTTPNYHGLDFISCFWGDADGNLVAPLTCLEANQLTGRLEEAFI